MSGLAASALGFVISILLLDSGGLLDWAQKLEVGPKRKVALPLAAAMERALHPLGLAELRRRELRALARVGWSDDPSGGEAVGVEQKPAGSGPTALSGQPGSKLATTTPPPGPNVPNALPPLASTHLPSVVALPPLAPIPTGQTRVVGLAGDSMMAVGLAAGLSQGAADHPQISFVRLYKSGTGLARPDAFNWMTEYPAMLGDRHPQVILVALGANDAQGFTVEGKVLPFGSDLWVAEYERRVQAYLHMLQQDGATVLWLGLPSMRSPVFDEHIQVINEVTYRLLSRTPGATWWPASALLGTDYEDYANVDGKPTKVRAGDGIHLTDDGAHLLTDLLFPWLQGPAVPTPPVPLPAQAPARSAPAAFPPAGIPASSHEATAR